MFVQKLHASFFMYNYNHIAVGDPMFLGMQDFDFAQI